MRLEVLDPITFDDARENPNQSDFMALILEDERRKRATWTMRRLNMKWNLMKTRRDVLKHYFEYFNFLVFAVEVDNSVGGDAVSKCIGSYLFQCDKDAFDPYQILDVCRDFSASELRTKWRQKHRECHPDRGGTNQEMSDINRAYQILKDPKKRKRHDDQFGQFGDNSRSALSQQTNIDDADEQDKEKEFYYTNISSKGWTIRILKEGDIQMVMDLSGVSKAKAISALGKNDNDIGKAIMKLTM